MMNKTTQKGMLLLVLAMLTVSTRPTLYAQTFNQMDENGDITQRGTGNTSRNFNPHNTDTTSKNKEIPRGLRVWTVDRKLGDIMPAVIDTMPHLYPQSTLGLGPTGEYNTVGNNYTARQSRIFINRPTASQFIFADAYSQMLQTPGQWHFTNTLSPITNLSYDNCGDKTNGEDHIDARFAANFNKRLGIGFDLNYLYARGYFQNQNNSHFGSNFFASYLGDRYQMHALLTLGHQKATENGGITSDEYLTHPEAFQESYQDNEIPVVLSNNWNRYNHQRLFLTHRYAVGFYRKVKMTEEELRAREFAQASLKEKMERRADSTRVVAVPQTVKPDSLSAIQAQQDSIDQTMKQEFVPVTSFIHTLEAANHDRIYQAYSSPADYYASTYFNAGPQGYQGDSIYDQTRHLELRNTLAVALLEGFNKYAPAGLKAFATHELRRYELPQLDAATGTAFMERWTENNVSIGGQLLRQQGHTLHYNLTAETWIAGADAGQLKLKAHGDLNFAFLGDTVRLKASAHFDRLNPVFLQRHYHSKHFWWDNDDMSRETRTGVEGTFVFEKTKTSLRVGIEEIQNYTYLALDYTLSDETRQQLSASVLQHSGNLSVLTAQLDQQLRLGPLHWDNTLTFQSSSNADVLPLPSLNVFSNLYLDFMVAHVLKVELGASATYFTRYYAPDFCPQLNQFAVAQNETARMKMGDFPFVDVYANLHLKHARFFVMMTNATGKSLSRRSFLAPHYPVNRSTLHFGISWNFFN